MKNKSSIILIVVLIMVSVLIVGCKKADEPAITATSVETSAPTATTEVTVESGLNVVTEQHIQNNEGNYQIPVTDAWFGKVAYEISGTKTTIYHLTQDTNELEINPTILVIDIANGDTDGEVFMEIAGVKYYHIPRFDFPYSEGSADAKEFVELSEDIPLMLQSFWTIDAIQDLDVIEPFSEVDAYLGDVYIGDGKENVLAKVGQPDSTEVVTLGATGEIRDINKFSFGELVFVDEKLIIAQITNEAYVGPRGLTIGMGIDEVIELFISEAEYSDNDLTIYYRQNGGGDLTIIVPPSAVLYDGAMQTIAFAAFPDASNTDGMSMTELEQDYMFMEQYELICQFDVQSVLTSYSIGIGSPSE